MKIEGWEPRALPSQARLDRWSERDGRWLHWALGAGSVWDACNEYRAEIVDADAPHWRPLTSDGQIAPWSEFDAATEPPVPEGYEREGEWGDVRRPDPPWVDAVLHESGCVYIAPDNRPAGRTLWLRKIAPPVTWADVPKEVTFETFDSVTMGIGVRHEGKRVGAVYELTAGRFSAHDLHWEPIPGRPFPSQPAAVMAVLRNAGVKK